LLWQMDAIATAKKRQCLAQQGKHGTQKHNSA